MGGFKPFNAEEVRKIKNEALKKLDAELKLEKKYKPKEKMEASVEASVEASKNNGEKNPELRRMEDAERERAKKADEEIKKNFPEEESEEAKILEIRDVPEFDETKKVILNKEEAEKIREEKNEDIIELTDVVEKGPGIREGELEKLKQEVEKSRKEYLETDYKKNNAFKRIYKFLGGAFKDKKERNFENDQDIAYYRAHYDNALFNYKNAVLEDAKNKKVSNKELGDILKFFEMESKISMAEGHDQARAENQEGKLLGYININASKMIESYKKLPLSKKIAIGAAFGFGAAAAGFAGSALAVGTVASAAMMRKIFMGMVAGSTAALVAENITQKNRGKSVEKEVSGFEKEMEKTISKEEINDRLEYKIDNLIYDGDQKINKIKNKNLRNLGIGIGVGFASSVLVPEFVKHGKEWFSHLGAGNKVMEHFVSHHSNSAGAPKISDHINPDNIKTEGAKDILPETKINAPATVHEESIVEMPKNIDVSVSKGGSLESAIIKNLEASGVNHKEAGGMAHRMYLDYIETHPDPTGKGYNLIHPNAHLELSPDGKNIVSFQDSPKAEWTDAGHSENPASEVNKIAENLRAENLAESSPNSPPPPLENPDGTINSQADGIVSQPNLEDRLNERAVTGAAVAAGGTIAGEKAAEKIKERKENKSVSLFEKRYKKMAKKYEIGEEDELKNRIYKIAKKIFENFEIWKNARGVKMENIKGKKSPLNKKLTNSVKALKKEWKSLLGEKANPEAGESVYEWLNRMVNESAKKEKI